MFPPWWRGGFPDIEKLLETLFTPLLTDVQFVPWLPAPDKYESQLNAGKAILRLRRTGGPMNFAENRDEPRVQFAAIARSRALSWELVEFCRQILFAGYYPGASVVPGTPHKLQAVGEVLGPQLIEENIAEPRLVPVTFGLYTWRSGGLNYRQALGL